MVPRQECDAVRLILDLQAYSQVELIIANSCWKLFPAPVDGAALAGNGNLDTFLGQGRSGTVVGRCIPARRRTTQVVARKMELKRFFMRLMPQRLSTSHAKRRTSCLRQDLNSQERRIGNFSRPIGKISRCDLPSENPV
jgi:hypothetical protein